MRHATVLALLFFFSCAKSAKEAFLESSAFPKPQPHEVPQPYPIELPRPQEPQPQQNPPEESQPRNPEIPRTPEVPEVTADLELPMTGTCSDNRTQIARVNLWQARKRNSQVVAHVYEATFPQGTTPSHRSSCLYATVQGREVGTVRQENLDLAIKKIKLNSSMLSEISTGCFTISLMTQRFPQNSEEVEREASLGLGNLVVQSRAIATTHATARSLTTGEIPRVLIGYNLRNSIHAPGEPAPHETPTPPHPAPSECDQTESPLIVDLRGNGVALSSQNDGVDFDIDGDGLRERISWPMGRDDAFLALPRAGRVVSTQELFGNNTVGPDGLLADNGFEALAKWDENQDGYITREDQVFHSLRLWIDLRRNGVSTRGELFPLRAFHIDSIDLNYIPMFESDGYGNETRERSVVSVRNSFRMIFDIWFRPL